MRTLAGAEVAVAGRWVDRGRLLPAGLPLRERLLMLRDLPDGPERAEFLHPDPAGSLGRLLGDPATLPDAAAATQRLAHAIAHEEAVWVYGDYDADGVTATAILVRGLRSLGGRVSWYVPHRVDEGFGLNEGAVRSLAERGARLIVTVDCGASDATEVALAGTLGVDVIVTDHHALPSRLPDAVAIVNLKRPEGSYPERRLSGAGVAYALLRALAYHLGAGGRMPAGELVQLAALGTVADVAPLRGENRLLVRAGLAALNRTPLPGLRAVLACASLNGCTVSEADLGFKLAPRLNAAGRMSHAGLACELLLESDHAKARALARRLEQLNDDRRTTTDGMLATAAGMVALGRGEREDVLFVYDEGWSPALLGIVAGRLSREHAVPVIAATSDADGVRASLRSVPGLDVIAALDGCRDLLTDHGGHAQAAGFSAPSATALQEVHEHLLRHFAGTRNAPAVEVDAELAPDELSPALVEDVEALAPYGAGNPEPFFGLRGVRVADVRAFGKRGDHLSFSMRGARGSTIEVVGFGMAAERPALATGAPVDIVARPLRGQRGAYRPLRLSVERLWASGE